MYTITDLGYIHVPHCKSVCIGVKQDKQIAVMSVHCIGFVMLQEIHTIITHVTKPSDRLTLAQV